MEIAARGQPYVGTLPIDGADAVLAFRDFVYNTWLPANMRTATWLSQVATLAIACAQQRGNARQWMNPMWHTNVGHLGMLLAVVQRISVYRYFR